MSSKDQPRCDKCKRFMAVQEADDIVVWHASCYLCVTCRLDDTCDGCVDWHQMDWVDFYDRRAALQHRKDQSAADQKAKASASGSASSKPSTVTQSGPGPLMGLVTATEMARHHRAASLSGASAPTDSFASKPVHRSHSQSPPAKSHSSKQTPSNQGSTKKRKTLRTVPLPVPLR